MKALSIHPYFAMKIAVGVKTVECRSWSTDYRGDLLICSTQKKQHGGIPGHALAVVTLADIEPFTRKHLQAADMAPSEFQPGMYAWILKDARVIKPLPVKGRLSLWTFDRDDEIEVLATAAELEKDPDLDEKLGAEYWDPITF